MIVADTSLLASLLLATPVTVAAETVLKKDSAWIAPALWRYEFRNVLATQIRVLGLPLEHALALFEKAEELMIEPEIEVEPKSILQMASARKLSAYDAEFLSLAYSLGVTLVTFDRGLLKAAPDVAVSPQAFGSS
jgi:predicted nucleic acid-binding protein